jgi:predicted O-methyltransferase YrrM
MVTGMQDRCRFRAVPGCSFRFDNLRHGEGLDTAAIFNDPAILTVWQNVYQNIAAQQPDTYRTDGINPGDRQALFFLLWALRPQSVLEVGTHIGASTIYIASALKTYAPQGVVDTVDILDVNAQDGPWARLGLPLSPREFAAQLGCLEHISFHAMPALAFMKDTDRKYDFIFLDGDHSSAAVYNEVSAALKILNPGGVILLHDYYPQARPLFPNGRVIYGPFRAMDRISREHPEATVCPLGQLPWATKQGVTATSLALVLKK